MYLNTHSYFSLRYGTLSPKRLMEAAKAKGIKQLVLTDINNSSGSYEFICQCQMHGIKPILGIEFRKNNRLLYIGIARNQEGFRALNAFLSRHSLSGTAFPDIAPPMENTFIIYRTLPKGITDFASNEFFGIRASQLNQLYRSGFKKYLNKLLIFSPITFLDEEGFKLHRLLRAIDLNTLISKLQPEDHARSSEIMHPPEVLKTRFKLYPEIVENTLKLLAQCSIELKTSSFNNRRSFTGDIKDDHQLLSKLAVQGCQRRYGNNRAALERTKKELALIIKLKYTAYFLITWDIIRYAQTMGYHYIGRGSGANSIVAYCLYITDVDPLELDLYFERFINPHRSSPPDFDIDFSWDERDDITDYIFKRYGKDYTALLATYNTFKGKSIIRELGRVFGLPKSELDQIIASPETVDPQNELALQIVHYGAKMEGFPNYLSIHAGGIIISEKPLHYFTALQLMPKGFPITQFDMYGAENLGFHKFDILSQRGLGHIKDAVELIRENQEITIDIRDVEKIKKDERVRTQLRSGHCIGCFYIESPAMRGLLTKLACDNYVHLVAASSIIRPGVAQSGMMRNYITRFHKPNSFDYLHPIFEKHLGETYGIMVYQEDVMKIVHHFAGLGLNESDILRRMMTGKRKSSAAYARLKQKYFDNCKKRAYPDALIKEVWRQIESFSGYSFCKAHSASFAVESFQSLYLKSYFPLEFMVAVINNFGGFYATEFYVHEARIQGANIHPPCVNQSLHLTTIYAQDIYLGFVHVYQLERKLAHRIVQHRAMDGPYQDLADFVNRVAISSEQLNILIRIGAFRFTGINKYELMWEKNAVFNASNLPNANAALFKDQQESFQIPSLKEGTYDQAFDEIELIGFPLCSPFELLMLDQKPKCLAKDLLDAVGKRVEILGYYVAKKNVTTKNGKRMNFGTWLDQAGAYFDTTHFPPSLKHSPFRGKACYRIKGKVVVDFGFPSIEVNEMELLAYRKDDRY